MKNILLFLFIIGVCSAWTLNYTPASCESIYSCLGGNYVLSSNGANLGCDGSSNFFYGMKTNNSGSASSENISIHTELVTSSMRVGYAGAGTFVYLYIQPPRVTDGNNYTLNQIGVSFTEEIGNETNSVVNGGNNIYLTYNNSANRYFVNLTTGEKFTVEPNGYIKIGFQSANQLLDIPYWNITTPHQPTFDAKTDFRFAGGNFLGYNEYNATYASLRTDAFPATSGSPLSSQYYRAAVYYSGSQLTPAITIFPSILARPYFYNTSDGTIFLKNNTVAYILDSSTQAWYLVPAVSITDYNQVITIGSYYQSSCTVPTLNSSIPLVPMYRICNQIGDQYVINSSYGTPVNHVASFNNDTYFNHTSSTSSTFYTSINTTLYPEINYTVNGVLQCIRNSNQQILFSPNLLFFNNVQTAAIILFQIMLVFFGILSIINPFALLIFVFFNDIFGLIPITNMAALATTSVLISIVGAGFNLSNMKNLAIYFVIGIAIITPISIQSGQDITLLTSAYNDLQTLFGIPNAGLNITSLFSLIAAPLFIIKFFLFLVGLPYIMVQTIMNLLAPTHSILLTNISFVLGALCVGIYGYLAIKGYEVGQNRFRDV